MAHLPTTGPPKSTRRMTTRRTQTTIKTTTTRSRPAYDDGHNHKSGFICQPFSELLSGTMALFTHFIPTVTPAEQKGVHLLNVAVKEERALQKPQRDTDAGEVEDNQETPGSGDGEASGNNSGISVNDHRDVVKTGSSHMVENSHFTCKPETGQHTDFIKENLKILQERCKEFHSCTQELYKSENFHLILSGKNIQLNTFCGLLYTNKNGSYTLEGRCSPAERKALGQSIGEALDKETNEPQPGTPAAKLRECINNNTVVDSSEAGIDTVCRMRMGATWPYLCKDKSVHNLTETVFNHELEHLHCSCNSLPSYSNSIFDDLPMAVKIGAACGAGLLVILTLIIIVFCCHHRKVKRQLKDNKLQIRYMKTTPTNEPSLIYQEIRDHPQSLQALSRERDPAFMKKDRPPTLPCRYVKDISQSPTNPTAGTLVTEPEYLIPLPNISHLKPGEPLPDVTSVGYSSAPLAAGKGQTVSAPEEIYYERIVESRESEEDGGYSTLGHKVIKNKNDEAANAEERSPLKSPSESTSGRGSSAEPSYFVLEAASTQV